MNRDDVISALNSLIAANTDGERGFWTYAENVKSPTLRVFFEQMAERAQERAAHLQQIAREMGGDRGEDSTDHRRWSSICDALIDMDDDHATLDDCERGEGVVRRVYEDALKQELPGDMRRLVERQYHEVKSNHGRIRELRNIAV